MVIARLHVICGNCGSLDLDYIHEDLEENEGEPPADLTHFSCNNCATNHYLDSWQEFHSYEARTTRR